MHYSGQEEYALCAAMFGVRAGSKAIISHIALIFLASLQWTGYWRAAAV